MRTWTCLLLSLAFSSVASAQTGKPTPAPVPAFKTAGAFFAIYVPDLGSSAKWYSEKLGLETVMSVPKSGKAAVHVLEGGGLIVELIQHDDAVPNDKRLIHGVFKAGLVVEEFDRTLAELKARNVAIAFGPYPASAGQRANAIIRDNNGNLIQFFARSSAR